MITLTNFIVACIGTLAISASTAFGINIHDYKNSVIIKGEKGTEWDIQGAQGAIETLTSFIESFARMGDSGSSLCAEALSYRAHAKLSAGDFEGAMTDANKSIGINAKLPLSYVIRSMIRRAMKNVEGAVVDCERAISLDSKFGMAYINLGAAKYLQRDYDGAISDYQHAKEVDSTIAKAAERGITETKAKMAIDAGRDAHERKLAAIGGDSAEVPDLLNLFIEEHFLKEASPEKEEGVTLSAKNPRNGDIFQLSDCGRLIQEQEIGDTDRNKNKISRRVAVTIQCSSYRKKSRANGQWSDWMRKRSYITGGDDPVGFAAVSFELEKRDGKWSPLRGAIPVPDMERLGAGVLLPIDLEKPSPKDLDQGPADSSRLAQPTSDAAIQKAPSGFECPICKGTGKNSFTSRAGGCTQCGGTGRLGAKQ